MKRMCKFNPTNKLSLSVYSFRQRNFVSVSKEIKRTKESSKGRKRQTFRGKKKKMVLLVKHKQINDNDDQVYTNS